MTFEEMVKKLAKDKTEIINGLTPDLINMLHMTIGISGESAELLDCVLKSSNETGIDMVNLREELGDIEFYMEGFRSGLGFPRISVMENIQDSIPNLGVDSPMGGVLDLSVASGDLLDVTKKIVIYRKSIDLSALLNGIRQVQTAMNQIYVDYDISREVVLRENMEKLGVRYEGYEYSDEQAHNRADKEDE